MQQVVTQLRSHVEIIGELLSKFRTIGTQFCNYGTPTFCADLMDKINYIRAVTNNKIGNWTHC